jgi:hypothetical protein
MRLLNKSSLNGRGFPFARRQFISRQTTGGNPYTLFEPDFLYSAYRGADALIQFVLVDTDKQQTFDIK